MSLINYSDIDFKNESMYQKNLSFDFFGNTIEVVPYLSINDKYALIMTTLNKSDEADLYNSFKTKFYFDLHLVLMYSNIVFSEEDKQDEVKLYDTLKSSGLMDAIIDLIPEQEKEELWNNIIAMQIAMMEYRRSVSFFVGQIFEKGPGLLEKVKETLTLLDENKVKDITQLLVQTGIVKK